MCRAELPPEPEQLHDGSVRRYLDVKRRVGRGEAPRGALTRTPKREMNEVIGLWRGAAVKGLAGTQGNLGIMHGLPMS